jgi:hypothetical protein
MPDPLEFETVSGSRAWTEVDAAVQHLEKLLDQLGDDSQLAGVDLQSALEKQQMLLDLLSRISTMLHETSTAIIRKIG